MVRTYAVDAMLGVGAVRQIYSFKCVSKACVSSARASICAGKVPGVALVSKPRIRISVSCGVAA